MINSNWSSESEGCQRNRQQYLHSSVRIYIDCKPNLPQHIAHIVTYYLHFKMYSLFARYVQAWPTMTRQTVSQIMPSALVVGYKSSVLETAWAKTAITTYGHTITLINTLQQYTSGANHCNMLYFRYCIPIYYACYREMYAKSWMNDDVHSSNYTEN